MTYPDDNPQSPQPPAPTMAEGRTSTDLVVTGQPLQPMMPAPWQSGLPAGPEILRNGFDPAWILHSFRRHWVLASGMGLLAGLGLAALVWFLTPTKSEAIALLKVSSVKPRIAFDAKETGADVDFETYKKTQLAHIKGPNVLGAALRRPGIAQLPSVRAEEPSPELWLKEELQVTYPSEGELMMISLRLENPQEAEQLVGAVVAAYMNDVIDKEDLERRTIFNTLQAAYTDLMENIRTKLQSYKDRAKEFGAAESEFASVDKDLRLERLHMLRLESREIDEELLNADLALKLLKTATDTIDPLDAAVQQQMESHPTAQSLRSKLYEIELRLAEEQVRSKRPDAPSIRRYLEQRQQINEQIAALQGSLRQNMDEDQTSSQDSPYDLDIKTQKMRKTHYLHRRKELQNEYETLSDEIRKLAETNVKLETDKSELEQLRMMASDIGIKVERWKTEVLAPMRVVVSLPATISPGSNSLYRYILTTLGGLAGFGLTAFAIAYWDFGYRRLNGPDQIDDGLGIRVVGALPSLAFRHSNDEADPVLAMLTESIDSIRTALMHASTKKETRVVMITSASGHEGRSTVASQLAASLARAGRRTLLVDGDLRHPTLHRLFDCPLEDGFCEVLRAETDVTEVVRPTQAEGLWLLTAGYCDAPAIQALAKDQVQPIIDRLKIDYDFIIIDAAPVLNLSDSLIMGQYADGVILSVLRDVSQVPRIHQARELLRSVGIRVIGAVVNGVREKPDGRVASLHLPAVAQAVQSEAAHDSTADST